MFPALYIASSTGMDLNVVASPLAMNLANASQAAEMDNHKPGTARSYRHMNRFEAAGIASSLSGVRRRYNHPRPVARHNRWRCRAW